MSSVLLIIDSKDRSSGSVTDFNYTFNRIQILKPRQFRINKINIPYTFYAIEQQNFTITYNAVPYVINIPAGNYSAPSLAQVVQTLCNASIPAPGITITYDINTNKMQFTATLGNTFAFDFSAYSGARANYNLGIGLGMVLVDDVSQVVAPATQFQSIYQCNLSATKNIYLKSQQLRLYNVSFFQAIPDNVIQSVPITVNSFGYIVWENFYPVIFNNDEQTISNIDFQLVDDYNNIINLNQYSFSIEIQIQTNTEL